MDNIINFNTWLNDINNYDKLSERARQHRLDVNSRKYLKEGELDQQTIKLDEPIVLSKPKKRKKVS